MLKQVRAYKNTIELTNNSIRIFYYKKIKI